MLELINFSPMPIQLWGSNTQDNSQFMEKQALG